MRGEVNKRHNKKITRACPVCGGRVTVGNRNQTWWVLCENGRNHIPQMPFPCAYEAITAWNNNHKRTITNADRIRSLSDINLALFLYWQVDGSGRTLREWQDWLNEEWKGEN